MVKGRFWDMRTVQTNTPTGITMITATVTLMHTELQSTNKRIPSLLQLIWLASPALPIGGFSYSEVLESAIAAQHVYDQDSASVWLHDQLMLSQARGDLSALAQLIRAWRSSSTQRLERLRFLNDWVHKTRESAELRLQTEQMGRSLLEWLKHQQWASPEDLEQCHSLGVTYPLAMSLALAQTQADVETCLQTYAFGWAENMVQAALKAVPLGQTSGQAILGFLAQHIDTAIDRALHIDDAARQSFSPMLSILSAQHETLYSRLFRS